MPLLEEKQKAELIRHFQTLKDEVNLTLFTSERDCEYCKVTRDLIAEVAVLSEKLKFRPLDFEKDQADAQRLGVDKVPALLVMGEEDYGIRFFGAPAGYEFSTLIEDILMVSDRRHGLPPVALAELDQIDRPVRLQVMVSTTCPYCPAMVRTAHRFAMANKFIAADMVDATEFPHLVARYEVQGVPHTMIGETYGVVGVYNELDFAREVLRGIGKLPLETKPHVHEHTMVSDSGPAPGHEHVHTHAVRADQSPRSAGAAGSKKKKPAPKKAAAGRAAKPGRKPVSKTSKPQVHKAGKKGGRK